MRRRRFFRTLVWVALSATLLLALAYGALGIAAYDVSGTAPAGKRLARMQQSPEWREGRFANAMPRVDGSYGEMVRGWFTGGSANRVPTAKIPIVSRRGGEFPDAPPPGLRATWLGHSTLLIDIDGQRVLVDPIFCERASPFTFAGPARFYPSPLPLAELPRVDAVLISHDHYDHLDTETVRALAGRDVTWIVPLGVGAHLAGWGVSEKHIVELDWWETARVRDLTVTATPARHFSGRSIFFTDQYRTLWSGYALSGAAHRVYYSGDTAMFDGFLEIGRRLGPFDLTLIEVGAYDRLWRDVHLGPEQAVRAHRLVRGKQLLPVHWGLFDLAMHGWTEPMERVLAAAKVEGVDVFTPRPGETIEVGAGVEPRGTATVARWWPTLPWQTAAQHDVTSSGVAHLLSVPAR